MVSSRTRQIRTASYVGAGVIGSGGVLSITGTPGPAAVGVPYSFVPVVTGGSGPKAFSLAGSLPAGLSFSSSTGAISGTPTSPGTTAGIDITVADASGSATRSGLSIVVSASAGLAMPSSASSIVVFGDSIANEVGASDSAHSWAALLAASLGATRLNKAISGTVLQNSDGGSGPLASNGRDRYLAALTSSNKREMAIIAYGFNDARYTSAPSTFNVSQYQNDLSEVIAGLLMTGYTADKIVVVSPYWISDTGLNTGSNGFSGQTRGGFEAFVAASAAVAAQYGTYYADVYAAMRDGGAAALIGADFIHPNDTGHAKVFQTVIGAKRTPVTPSVTPFFVDNFTDTDGTAITSHTSDSGHTWSVQQGYSPTSPNLISGNKLYSQTAMGVYRASAVPPSADYAVGAILDPLSVIASDNVGVFGRASVAANTLYWARYNRSVNAWQLFKTVSSTTTQLGANVAETFTETTGARYIELRMKGTTISLTVMGVEIISVTDNAISAAGFAGVRMGLAQGAATGIQIDSIKALAI